MNENMNGVRGEVTEYTWGRLWSDGTREFNNGALLYADGSLEFDGLTFYPDGVIIDAAGRQVGLAEPIDETQDLGQPAIDEEPGSVEQEEVEDAASPVDELQALNIEDSDDVESYMSLGGDER
ncbi:MULTISPECIES: hypothetical protein [unclassified Pseudomonas]|uniref:hypothetical protein n=1 Tax=unclassified Pseudomonas TaxID=196821 RepID=UPI0010328940|nr:MULTISPECIES: hypothetical protein [unclassified Pseudomonas]